MNQLPTATLLWYAAEFHPLASARAAAKTHLDSWLLGLADPGLRRAIAKALRAERGTPIEPFSLTENDIELAAGIGLAALSCDPPVALQIISRDKFEPLGGCLLRLDSVGGPPGSMSVGTTYVQRLAPAWVEPPHSCWRFAPGFEPPSPEYSVKDGPRASLRVDDNGYNFSFGPLPRAERAWTARAALTSSSVLETGVTLDRMGLEAKIQSRSDGRKWLTLRPGSPEAAIRFTGLLLQRSSLLLGRATVDGVTSTLCAARLSLPPDNVAVELPVIPVIDAGSCSSVQRWLTITSQVDLNRPSPSLCEAVARWVGVPETWLGPELMEAFD